MSGATFGGNPVSCAAAIAGIQENLAQDLCLRSREMGAYLRQRLYALDSLGIVGEIRGKGLQTAVELVKDPATKLAFPREVQIGLQIGQRSLRKGVLTRYRYDWIEFTPPLIITQGEIDTMVDVIYESAKEVLLEIERGATP